MGKGNNAFLYSCYRRRKVEPSMDDASEEDLEEQSEMEIEENGDGDVCLGLSYRRGLRRNLFDKSGGHFISKLGGDLWSCNENSVAFPINNLERIIPSEHISNL